MTPMYKRTYNFRTKNHIKASCPLCGALFGWMHQYIQCQKTKFCRVFFFPPVTALGVSWSFTPVTASPVTRFPGSALICAGDCACFVAGSEARGGAGSARCSAGLPVPLHGQGCAAAAVEAALPLIKASRGEKQGRSGPVPSVAASSRGPAAACQQGTALPVVNFNWPSGESTNH